MREREREKGKEREWLEGTVSWRGILFEGVPTLADIDDILSLIITGKETKDQRRLERKRLAFPRN